jgi:hypothetical protein
MKRGKGGLYTAEVSIGTLKLGWSTYSTAPELLRNDALD